MPLLEYFLVAESVSADVKRNTISIFHVLSDVRVEAFPGVIETATAVAGWISSAQEIKDRVEAQIKLVIRTPSKPEGWEFRSNFKAEVKYQNFSFGLRGIPVDTAGEVTFELLKDDEHVAKHTLTVAGPED